MKRLIPLLMLMAILAGCSFQVKTPRVVQSASQDAVKPTEAVVEPVASPTEMVEETELAVVTTPEPTEEPTLEPTVLPVGPVNYPENVNPLTGLPVADPSMLAYPPALVSITNFPLSARPQAGLSFAPIVYELYIGEGMSRFLAMFYGDFPAPDSVNDKTVYDNYTIGPIRSGRLPYETLRQLYHGYLVMASAYSGVAANLGSNISYFGSDSSDINSAMLSVSKLKEITTLQTGLKEVEQLQGNMFDPAIPDGGKLANRLVYFYSNLNQLYWQYDSASGSYHRFQDNSDGLTFTEMTDQLTGEPLEYENVVVLFANHNYCNETVLDIEMLGIKRYPALLFRDGQVYSIYWTTYAEEYEQTTGYLRPIRFVDADGNPFPLKPGQTWVHLTPLNTSAWESVDSTVMFDFLNKPEPGSGNWVVRFYADMMQFDEDVCEKVGFKK